MKGTSRVFLLLVVVVHMVFSAGICLGAGFALYEASARGNALAGSMAGKADDPSALFFNPAGITQLPGIQMMAGATFIMPTTDVTTHNPQGAPGITTSTEHNLWVPPHFYATYQATDSVWFGLGIFSPFGLGTEFADTWPGRFNSYKAVIQTATINPTIAFKVNDKVSLAAGFDIMYFDLTLKRKISTNFPSLRINFGEVDRSLEGSSVGYGFNFGIHYNACDWMKLGASYRSQVAQNVSGTAKFTKPAGFPTSAPFNTLFNTTSADGMITLPDELFLGATFYPIKDLSLEIDAIWTRWSTYNALAVNYAVAPVPSKVFPFLYAPGQSDTYIVDPKNWHDTWRISLGAEYKTTKWLDLRAGFAWDQEAIYSDYADYLVPANDRFLFSFGPGFHWGKWSLDLSYTYLLITNRDDVPPHGNVLSPVYQSEFKNGYANMVGCSVGYKF